MGRKKITQYTRYGTVVLSIIQSTGIALWLEKQTTPGGAPLVLSSGWAFRLMTILTLTTGTCFIMWLGEQITERGSATASRSSSSRASSWACRERSSISSTRSAASSSRSLR